MSNRAPLEQSSAARPLPWLIAILGFSLDVAAYWPGQMSFDSAYAWWQVRGGETTDIVSPAMIMLWRAGDAFLAGPGCVFVLHLALFWSGLALLSGALRLRTAATIALMTVAAFASVPWLLRGHVWTDVGLFCTLTFAAGALATAQTRRRRAWLALALPALFYAAALRLNALPAVLPLAAWWGWLALGDDHATWMRCMFATLALCVLLSLGVAAINARVERHVPVWTSLAQWDLAALSIASGEMLLPDFMIGPGLDVAELAQAFRPWSNTPMLQNTRHGMRDPFASDYTAGELSSLRHAWLSAIARHPRAWLAHRWRLSRALFGTHDAAWPRELIYVDDEFQYRDNPAVARNASGLHRMLMRAAASLSVTPLLAGWPYALIGGIAAPFAWRRRRRNAGAIALTLLASAWLYALTLVALAPAAELRYLGWTSLASLLAAACAWLAENGRADKLVPAPDRGHS
jgi:hypothetical protein